MGCIIISLVICHRWLAIMKDQMEKITGLAAPEEYINSLKSLIGQADSRIDMTRITNDGSKSVIAYFAGSKYNVEANLPLRESIPVDSAHEISLRVKQSLEELDDIERAIVHVRRFTLFSFIVFILFYLFLLFIHFFSWKVFKMHFVLLFH